MDTTSTRTRWGWPWILAIPAAGLGFETVVMTRAYTAGGEVALDGLGIALLFWAWVALPFVGAGLAMAVAVGRSRLAWWLTMGVSAAVSLFGGWISVDFLRSASSTAALVWIFAPVVQLTAVVALTAAVLPLSLPLGRRRSPQRPVRS